MKFLAVFICGVVGGLSALAADPPIWRGPICGAVTSDSAWVKAKLRYKESVARLVVSKSVDLSAPIWFGPMTAITERGNMVEFRAQGLDAGTQYYYGLEVNGAVQLDRRGAFKTFPPVDQPASFNFAFGSCARTGSENPVFSRIRELHPLFYLNTGDFHYEDIASNALVKFRMAYDQVLFSPVQAALYRAVPLVYIWDDHDFAGNNSDRRAPSHYAARVVYEEYMPHYDTPAGDGDVPIYQSFAVGRVKFILTDLRSERDPVTKPDGPGKSMLGAAQKAWFKKELLATKDKYPLIIWASSVPWIGIAGVNHYPINSAVTGFIHQTNAWQFKSNPATAADNRKAQSDDDFWGAFAFERREIANFIRDNKIFGLCILHGDAHMLAADNGTHSDYSTGGGPRIPVMAAAPLDQDASIKGGPYSQGVYKARKGEGCFGYVQVRDDGAKIDVRYSGRNYLNEEKISLNFSVPVN
ncbi:MAG TPA: alkaline phosphatase D family protein [Candidatus Limnocylindria bacterium]|nr:alkaline phosphatase D family protein [Candidatus Limnocylindria bacterium]